MFSLETFYKIDRHVYVPLMRTLHTPQLPVPCHVYMYYHSTNKMDGWMDSTVCVDDCQAKRLNGWKCNHQNGKFQYYFQFRHWDYRIFEILPQIKLLL